MPILYALVSSGTTILSEFAKKKGNFQTVAKQILEKIPARNTKVTYEHEEYLFHISVDNRVTFFCVSDKDFGNRIPFLFLSEVTSRFQSQYPNFPTNNPLPRSLKEFDRVLQIQIDHFNDSKNDRFSSVKGKLNEVRDIMIDNIDKVLERGEKIELLVDRTQDLADSGQNFRIKSKKLKNTMWWKNIKLICLLMFIIAIVLLAVIWLICGITFQNCRAWFSGQ